MHGVFGRDHINRCVRCNSFRRLDAPVANSVPILPVARRLLVPFPDTGSHSHAMHRTCVTDQTKHTRNMVAAALGRTGIVLASIVALTGCSESTIIRTDPPGATVWINQQRLGISPVKFKARSWSVRPRVYHYRIEKPDYLPREGYLNAHLSIERIVSAYLSSCMSCGHGFYELDETTNVVLARDPDALAHLTTAERIEELSRAYGAGLIDRAELHQARVELLRETATPESSTRDSGQTLLGSDSD